MADLGLDELVSGGGIVAIEWAERWDERPDDAIDVRIEDTGEDRRQITDRAPGVSRAANGRAEPSAKVRPTRAGSSVLPS